MQNTTAQIKWAQDLHMGHDSNAESQMRLLCLAVKGMKNTK